VGSKEGNRIFHIFNLCPANVRELANGIQRAMTLCQHEFILQEDLPGPLVLEKDANIIRKGHRAKYTMEQLEKGYNRKA